MTFVEGDRAMRVRILSHIVGKPSYVINEIVDLEPRVAKAWIEAGIARIIDSQELLEHAVRVDTGAENRCAMRTL